MGCFFCCFKVRDDHRPQINRVSQPITAIPKVKEPVDSLANNSLWPVLVSEDDSHHSPCKAGKYGVTGSSVSDDGLRAEAEFLKACGTLPETPVEIRKTEQSQDSQSRKGDKEATLHSWLPNTSIEKVLEKQPDQLPSPIKLFEEKENGSDYSSRSSNSLKDSLPHNGDTESTIYSWVPYTPTEKALEKQPDQLQSPIKLLDGSDSSDGCGVANTQFKNKSVRFEAHIDACSSSVSSIRSSPKITNLNLKPFVSPLDHNLSKPSPYPTPLKLTDDMQTPGTVFPSYNKETGKNQRIRIQYPHSGINPENLFQLKAPIEEDISFEECLEKPQSQVNLQKCKTQKELNVGATLSSWPPPKSNYEGCIDQCLVSISQDLPDFGQTPGFRPINGIPNTTTKYKEDQKVSWHATPFEQRLEKALLEDERIVKSKQLETVGIEF